MGCGNSTPAEPSVEESISSMTPEQRQELCFAVTVQGVGDRADNSIPFTFRKDECVIEALRRCSGNCIEDSTVS